MKPWKKVAEEEEVDGVEVAEDTAPLAEGFLLQ